MIDKSVAGEMVSRKSCKVISLFLLAENATSQGESKNQYAAE
jgi:hypothetical protein